VGLTEDKGRPSPYTTPPPHCSCFDSSDTKPWKLEKLNKFKLTVDKKKKKKKKKKKNTESLLSRS